ncbi:DUF4190 domain-containing protein [Arenivirga flava]|uniref:Septum formation-related domain-containing protein n=1 Tax=Arenivirga flava TaxID=1930060 RepID=A0AA37ULG7_9MICO|nr:DUF4190 domain-containing protein [Arenivirga flava]GMA27171.1 hypothetical protein GCM10025874_04240 [Arenivirga flava]
MSSPVELLFSIPAEPAKVHLAAALQEQGFSVSPSASGGLLVKRGSLGTTLVAGALAGNDMHVEFGIEVTPTPEGTLAQVRRSAASGFLKGGAIGAAKTNDVIQTAMHQAGARLAQQGVLVGTTPSADPTQPAPMPYLPPPVDYAGRTNVVAIVALVLGFLFPLGGIIAGAVALAQVKRTGEKGRGLAIGGIVVGSLATLLLIGIVAVATIVGIATSSQTAPPVTAPQSSSVPEEGGDEVDVFSVAVGDCINDFGTGEVNSVEALDCALPHDYEVYSEITIPGNEFPGQDAVTAAADDQCVAAFDAFVGLGYQESLLDFSYLAPTADSWQLNDDRLITCLIYDPAGQTSGSLAGAAR